MQVIRHGGEEVDQTKGAEHVFAATLPRVEGGFGTQRPHTNQVFEGEKHHAPKLQLMEKVFVLRVNLRDRVQNHRCAIDQDDD